jgi:pyrimidine operon attenuation protein / uracil phosphoribosyltransferase
MSQSNPTPPLDAEQLYSLLLQGLKQSLQPDALLVGIWSGGAWLAERLHRDLQRPGEHGVISSALHRDDFDRRGMATGVGATRLPVSIDARDVVLVDDVLHTGRTIRAVINELYDFGRPARVSLVVLVDRNGRELPIEPTFAATKVQLPTTSRLHLARADDGRFSFKVKDVSTAGRTGDPTQGTPR